MSDTHRIDTGDTVRIGQGYQRWTVKRRDGDVLTLQSDPSRAEIAGSQARTKVIAVDRVTLIEAANERGTRDTLGQHVDASYTAEQSRKLTGLVDMMKSTVREDQIYAEGLTAGRLASNLGQMVRNERLLKILQAVTADRATGVAAIQQHMQVQGSSTDPMVSAALLAEHAAAWEAVRMLAPSVLDGNELLGTA